MELLEQVAELVFGHSDNMDGDIWRTGWYTGACRTVVGGVGGDGGDVLSWGRRELVGRSYSLDYTL